MHSCKHSYAHLYTYSLTHVLTHSCLFGRSGTCRRKQHASPVCYVRQGRGWGAMHPRRPGRKGLPSQNQPEAGSSKGMFFSLPTWLKKGCNWCKGGRATGTMLSIVIDKKLVRKQNNIQLLTVLAFVLIRWVFWAQIRMKLWNYSPPIVELKRSQTNECAAYLLIKWKSL
jgi:hypothetical protein